MRYFVAAGLVACTSIVAAPLAAQCGRGGPALPAMSPGTIVGVVTDTADVPLGGIRIVIGEPRRDERTDAMGRFRIDALAPGKYEVIVRRVGYEPAVAIVDVTADGGSARICMGVAPRGLAPMVTSIFRGGLSGVVADTAHQLVSGTEVRTLGKRNVSVTDSAGAFFLDLGKGSYVVMAYKQGFARQIVSVTIPKDSGRQIAVWLTRADGRENRRVAALEDLRERILKSTEFRNKLLMRDELGTTGLDIVGAVSAAAMRLVEPTCDVQIGGLPNVYVPLWSLNKDEIELFEVYRGSAQSARGVKSINSAGTTTARPPIVGQPRCGQLKLVAWLRP